MHIRKLPNSHENNFLSHYKIIILLIVRSLNPCGAQDSAFLIHSPEETYVR